MPRKLRYQFVSVLAVLAVALLVLSSSAVASSEAIGAGYKKTFTTAGATCGYGVVFQWKKPGGDPVDPGLKTPGQVAGTLRSVGGQALTGQLTACLNPEQRGAVTAKLNIKLGKPSTFIKTGLLRPKTFFQEGSSHAAAPIIQPMYYDGKPTLKVAYMDLTVKVGAPRPVIVSQKTNPDGGTTTVYGWSQDYIDAQLVWPYICGNLSANFRSRTVVTKLPPYQLVPVVPNKIARINGKQIALPANTFTAHVCWTNNDPYSGQPQAQTCVSPDPLLSEAGTSVGYAEVGVKVAGCEINVPPGWIAVDSQNVPTSLCQSISATAETGAHLTFINNRTVSGCICTDSLVYVSTTPKFVTITICGWDTPVTPDMVSVTINGVVLPPVQATPSAPGTYQFTTSYGPITPGTVVVQAVINDPRGFTFSFDSLQVNVLPIQ